ncbi:hypothetical protein J31TS4_43280 [Paenibacillus sp. J31TS4]|uniref:hypothetical protein n=1 Tax=Paenibacillus sp. J31TS4 TaxID=2807195 RepID=UPI001B148AE0|nr:hypothetical protein [Paenibacillus sp. J31TS4]GIP41048.1 hypothetical protein J31TS4_43280 [Paenibacillus sp. J31TS4]
MRDELTLRLQLECTLFFEANPYTLESVQGLALRLGRRPDHLETILGRLVELAILERLGEGQRAIYRYIQPAVAADSDLEWARP